MRNTHISREPGGLIKKLIEMRKILITGACGYLGSQLLRSIETMKGQVQIKILDNFSSGSYSALMNLPSNVSCELIEGDILNTALINYAMKNVDTVIHLAAIVRTPMGFGTSNALEQVNQWGTRNVLEAALTNKVNHFVYASATAVYGPEMEGKSCDEFRPFGHYANSLFKAEKSIKVYIQRGLPATVIRFGTLYGLAPIMRFTSAINRLVNMAGTKETLTIFGSGKQTRPFITVKDAVNAIIFCLDNSEKSIGKMFNAFEENYSINSIAAEIQKIKPEVKLHFTDQDIRNHFSFSIKQDLLQEIGWGPKHLLPEVIKEQINRYQGFKDKI
ncbi:NAD(P)-dependent oxidoreductase [bacterium]|nr:NAD(P)-dependent oxidoreductase [bacterium]